MCNKTLHAFCVPLPKFLMGSLPSHRPTTCQSNLPAWLFWYQNTVHDQCKDNPMYPKRLPIQSLVSKSSYHQLLRQLYAIYLLNGGAPLPLQCCWPPGRHTTLGLPTREHALWLAPTHQQGRHRTFKPIVHAIPCAATKWRRENKQSLESSRWLVHLHWRFIVQDALT